MSGKPRVSMRNLSGLKKLVQFSFYTWVAIGILPLGQAKESAMLRPSVPEVSVTESSKPVFDPKLFDTQPTKVEAFFLKLREENIEFSLKQRDRKRKFMEKIQAADMDPEKRQKKVLKFNEKAKKKLEKVHQKRKKEILKYYRKKGLA